MSNTPPGDSAQVATLRPKPESMAEFLPLWNARIAHIEASDTARARIAVLMAEGVASPDRLKELQDGIDAHAVEIAKLTTAMATLQYNPALSN